MCGPYHRELYAAPASASVFTPVVCLAGLDAALHRTLRVEFERIGIIVTACAMLDDVVDLCRTVHVGCVVTDAELPNNTAPQLLRELATGGEVVPVIVFSSDVDVSRAVKAMKAGAFDCLENRGDISPLLAAVPAALAHGRRLRELDAPRRSAMKRLSRLTRREREVFRLVADGLANKQVAHRLGIADKTVETHRSRVMSKMEARSLAELVRMAHVLDMFKDETSTGAGTELHSTSGTAERMPA